MTDKFDNIWEKTFEDFKKTFPERPDLTEMDKTVEELCRLFFFRGMMEGLKAGSDRYEELMRKSRRR